MSLTLLKNSGYGWFDLSCPPEEPRQSKLEVLYVQYARADQRQEDSPTGSFNYNLLLAEVLREYADFLERGIAGGEPVENYLHSNGVIITAAGSILGKYGVRPARPGLNFPFSPQL